MPSRVSRAPKKSLKSHRQRCIEASTINQSHAAAQQALQQLNPLQRQAARYIDTPLLVLAGAGSGKTSVITHKIAWLIGQCAMSPRAVTAVTFTNKAAREMKQRVAQLLPAEACRGLTVCTFHRLGLNLLSAEAHRVARQPGFTIFDETDCGNLVKELLLDDSDAADALVALAQQQIGRWKNQCLDPDDAARQVTNQPEARIVELYRRYEQALTSYNAVDFDDLIKLPVQILEQHPDVLERWQNRIRYLLVDEYQDTNGAQYRLVRLLVGPRSGLTVVGDDDQSIYAWRGADPENLRQLTTDYPALKVIKLEQNYRSTNRILRSANQLIDHNPHLFSKQLWSDKGLGDPIRAVRCADEEAEVEHIANTVVEQRLIKRCRFNDFAVLVRSSHQTRLLELKLRAQQVPYHLTGGTPFFARAEIKDLLAYLRVLVNPDDDAALLRIINVPRRKIGTATLQALGDYARERSCSLLAAMGELGLAQRLPQANYQRLAELSQWLEHLRRQLESNPPIAVIREMLGDIDYPGWLHQTSSSPDVAERRLANVALMLDSLERDLRKHIESSDSADNALDHALKAMLLRDLLDQQAEEDAQDKVQLMTLHAAKGLEFPHVFIMGFEENQLPHRNSIEAGTIEEERRLAYVGITRAKQTLTLLMAAKRKQFGETIQPLPSRFLEELPAEDLQKSGFGGEADRQATEAKASATISSLRELFD